MKRIRVRRPSPAKVVAVVALVVALTGSAYAAATSFLRPAKERSMRRGRQLLAGVVVAAGVAAAFATTATADQVYHTERLTLTGVAGAPGGGMLVNIHANGPKVYSIENYVLRHTIPGTYQAILMLHPFSLDCSGPSFAIPITTIVTNAEGNGHAQAKATPEDVDGLRGATVSISWSVTGPAEYVTGCTVVPMD